LLASSRVRRSAARGYATARGLLRGAFRGWRATLQRVDRPAPEKRVGCAGGPHHRESRPSLSARNYFCGTRETGAAWWPSARLIVRRVRRDYKKEERKKAKEEEQRREAGVGAAGGGLQRPSAPCPRRGPLAPSASAASS
jgi:hypothetical protein